MLRFRLPEHHHALAGKQIIQGDADVSACMADQENVPRRTQNGKAHMEVEAPHCNLEARWCRLLLEGWTITIFPRTHEQRGIPKTYYKFRNGE